MNINTLANHILAVANKENMPITNLQLHKTLFFTIGIGTKEKIQEIKSIKENYNGDFARWRYGPVVPELYHKYNHWGYRPIDDSGEYEPKLSNFDKIIKFLLDIDVYKLVSVSHQMKAWAMYEEAILNKEYVPRYNFEEIERDFANA